MITPTKDNARHYIKEYFKVGDEVTYRRKTIGQERHYETVKGIVIGLSQDVLVIDNGLYNESFQYSEVLIEKRIKKIQEKRHENIISG